MDRRIRLMWRCFFAWAALLFGKLAYEQFYRAALTPPFLTVEALLRLFPF